MYPKTSQNSTDPILRFHASLEKLSGAASMAALLETSLKEALDLVQAEVGSLFLVDEEKNEFVLKEASGNHFSRFPGIRRSLNEGILGYVAKRRVPLLVEDIRKDERFRGPNGNGSSGYHTSSFISVPIVLQGRLLGVLNLTDKISRRPFSRKDLEWMTLFVHDVALNIERNRTHLALTGHHQTLEHYRNTSVRLEEEKRHLASQLALSQKMASIGKLAAGIAHELNNPLDGTLRYIHLSLSHLKEGDMVREYLLEVKQGLDRMTNIVKNLLAFSRRERKPQKSVNVNEALENALSHLTDYSYPLRVEVIKAYHPDLPLLLDKGIDRLFTNIIRNAFDAMPRGGTLRIATLRNEEEILVRITDTGHGILEENRASIFEPFFTTKEIDKGCGLGLAICDEIIRAYEGRIDVESQKNQGATFLIRLPMKYTIPKEATFSYAG